MAANGYVEETLALRMVKGLCRRRSAPVEGAPATVCAASDTCEASDASDGGWTPIVWPEAAPAASATVRQLRPVPVRRDGEPEVEAAAAATAPEPPRSSGADARGWPRRVDIAPAGRLLRRERGPGEVPGGGRRRRLAPVGLAAAALIPFGGAAAQGALAMAATPAAAAVLPHTVYTGSPPVVDGKLDALYSGSFSSVSYTETGGKHSVANGQLAVIETPDAYYIGFQQGLTFKSNAYCPTTGNPADCYQRFRDLTGSDHISFVWTVAGKTIQVGVDILTANSAAQYGYSGMVKSPLTGNIGEGLSLLGCDPSGVTGFSGMDYNWHHAGAAGWGADAQAGSYSPNFVGKAAQYPDYVYPSTAEVRLSKAACGLSDGTDMTHPAITAHDSPEAPWSSQPQKFLVCDAANPVTAPVGSTVDLTVDLKTVDPMTGNTTPTANQAVVTGIANGPAQITRMNGVLGTTKGTSTAAGTVVLGVTSATAGSSDIWAAADLNASGSWDQASEPVTNPACHITFQGQPPSQSISGHIYDCTGGVATANERLGGSIWATGPQSLPAGANPLGSTSVAAGTYTMSASAPAGYQFVTCGGAATPGSPPTTATTSVVVPSGSSGVGIFYVAPTTAPSQSISGHIYDCTGGVATANERLGGSIWATGPQNLPVTGNPLSPLNVLAGTYTMSASAPAGYQFVTCGGQATPGSPPTTATTSVVVPTNGTGVGIFYVAPATVPSQTIEGHIYDCTSGAATMSEVPGGILSAAGPQSLAAGPNPMAPANVAAGTYTMSALAPPGYHFVSCGGSATIYSPPTTGATSVLVPTGGAGVGVFYVAPDPITFTAVKVNNADGQGAWLQTETAPSPGATVPFRVTVINTSTVSITVASLTDSWPGQVPFSPSCSQALVGKVLAPGASATCEFSVPNYAPAAAASLTDTATVTACQTTIPGNCAVAKPTSTVDVVQVLGESITPPTPTAPTVTPSSPTQLAFTGPSVPIGRMLGLAGLLLAAGLGLLAISRPGGRRACWRR